MKDIARIPFVDSIRKLEVYKRAYSISLTVHKASLQFPTVDNMLLPVKSGVRANRFVQIWVKALLNKNNPKWSSDDLF